MALAPRCWWALWSSFFFFNDTATTEIYTLSLHDALPICTNGMFIKKRLHEFKPDKRFYFNVHLDGMEKNHDIAVEKEGVFRDAIEGIKVAKAAGFQVCTNTTVYK